MVNQSNWNNDNFMMSNRELELNNSNITYVQADIEIPPSASESREDMKLTLTMSAVTKPEPSESAEHIIHIISSAEVEYKLKSSLKWEKTYYVRYVIHYIQKQKDQQKEKVRP